MDDAPKKNYSVLLIDDDKFLLDMYSLKFQAVGCQVEAIADPAVALEKLRKGGAPDVILLDVVMPVLSGFELLETIKKEGLAKRSVVIILSNQGTQEDIDKALQLGAAGYIVKASSIPSEVLQKTLAIVEAQTKK